MIGRFLRWAGSIVAGGLLWWLVTLGGGFVVSSVVAGASGLEQPWVSLLAAGVFMVSVAAIITGIRVALGLLPPKARRQLQGGRSASPSPLLRAFRTPQQQLSDLIEEGRRWLRYMPAPAEEPAAQLAQMMTGTDIDYPAKVYEWEMRAWRVVSSSGLAQWRGLFPQPDRAQRLPALRAHLTERIGQLETILGRL